MMVSVMVFYNPPKERNPKKGTEIKKQARGAIRFISPRMFRSTDGTPHLLLDNPIRDNSDVSIPQMLRVTVEDGHLKPQVATISTEKRGLGLKSKCCEKYLKGKRCKRCPCFDLQ